MKTVLLALICVSLATTSCYTDRKFSAAFTAKGCDINSIRKQSELVFKKMDKRKKIPDGYFKTEIIENDNLVLIQRLATNGNIRNTGGVYVEISKTRCKVTSLKVF